MMRKVFQFLGSLKLALILLAVIIIASILGTYWESSISAEVARKLVYGSLWFDLWLSLLCVNLFAVAAIRYPWKPHQYGFVITHAGIIILLIGSMIDRHWGVEGFVQLHRGAAPTDVMELRQQELVVSVDGVAESAHTSFNNKSADRAFTVKSPTPDVKVEVIDSGDVESYQEVSKAESGDPAIRLRLEGPMMGRQERWLFLGNSESDGPATLAFEKGMPVLTKPVDASAKEDAVKLTPRQERYYIFSKQKDNPMITLRVGEPTQAEAMLVVDPKTAVPTLSLKLLGREFNLAINGNEKKDLPLEGLDGWKVFIFNYYPNFRMINKQATTQDNKPENPALFFDLLGPLVNAKLENPTNGHGNGEQLSGQGGNALRVYLGDDGKLRYLIKSAKKGEFTGELTEGKSEDVRWVPGTTFTIDQFLPHSKSTTLWQPITKTGDRDGRTPGLKCRVTVAGESVEAWLAQSVLQIHANSDTGDTIVELPRKNFSVGRKTVGIAYANEHQILPFTVGLFKFSAPHDEGLEESMSFASFESTLSFDGRIDRVKLKPDAKLLQELKNGQEKDKADFHELFDDGNNLALSGAIISEDATKLTLEFENRKSLTIQKSDIAAYRQKTHKIFMNSPTTYPATWWGPWLGTTYKFSQADHRMPMDPDYSGVQVVRDPGWMPKWVGCLMICFGIFTMFYLKPYFTRRVKTVHAVAPEMARSTVKTNLQESETVHAKG